MPGEMGDIGRLVWCDDDAPELLLYRLDARLWDIKGDAWVFKLGRRGEVARGVADGVRSSESKVGSRGVMGRSMPGVYPGRRGVGDVVRDAAYGEARPSSAVTGSSDDSARPVSPSVGECMGDDDESDSTCGRAELLLTEHMGSCWVALTAALRGDMPPPCIWVGGTCVMGDRSMTISSSPSSSSSRIAWSSASDALLSPSGERAFESRLLSELEYSLRSFDNVLASPGLDGADPENVYVLPSGVVGRRLSPYVEDVPPPLSSRTLAALLMLAAESDSAIAPAPAAWPLPRAARRGLVGAFAVRRKYAWSRNLPEPKRLLLIRRLDVDPFADDMDTIDGAACSDGLVTELAVEERTDSRTLSSLPAVSPSSSSAVLPPCASPMLSSYPPPPLCLLRDRLLGWNRPSASKIISSSSSVT